MERITSRKNSLLAHLRKLAGDSAYRRERGEFVCDGEKLLHEALQAGAEITAVVWNEDSRNAFEVEGAKCCAASGELIEYASPLKNSPGPLFSVRMAPHENPGTASVIVLETVQDPGNVGTVIRTACALGIGQVLLCGGCADLYNPKTVRATMGAIFRQCVRETSIDELKELTVPIYGAALSANARDIRGMDLGGRACAVAIGSEGRGLSEQLLSICSGELIIPMIPGNESLNAAVAASLVMWEMSRDRL